MASLLAMAGGAGRQYVRGARKAAMRSIASHSLPRRFLNAYYETLSPADQEKFHRSHAKIFNAGDTGRSGKWRVAFAGKPLVIPIRSDRMWLDWDLAVSLVGHDSEIKQTYAALLDSPNRPELFVDIGGNYGTHSLLFLAHGVPAITFEPNHECCKEVAALCEANGVKPRIERVALGAEPGAIVLRYPEYATWWGSTSADAEFTAGLRIVTQECELRTLDSYALTGRMLVKIDTEGYEVPVLLGAVDTLKNQRPMVIFESLGEADRLPLFDLFRSHSYALLHLPWFPGDATAALTRADFLASKQTNFIAVPTPS